MPMAGGTATRLTSGMGYNAQPRFSPDGDRIVFVSDRDGGDNVWVVSTDLTDTIQVTRGKTNGYLSPVFTPDGAYVVASKGGRAQKPWIYHLEGGSGTALFDEPDDLRVTGLAFGPDSRGTSGSPSAPGRGSTTRSSRSTRWPCTTASAAPARS